MSSSFDDAIVAVITNVKTGSKPDPNPNPDFNRNNRNPKTTANSNPNLKGTLRRRIAYIFLVHLESIYYEIFFYSKIVPNCAVAK